MILQAIEFIQLIADIVAAILNFLSPIVSPLGAWMVSWIEVALKFFPQNDMLFYIILFVIIVALGCVVNTVWPGDKKPKYLEKHQGKERSIKEVKVKAEKTEEQLDEAKEKLEGKLEKIKDETQDHPEEIEEKNEEFVGELEEELKSEGETIEENLTDNHKDINNSDQIDLKEKEDNDKSKSE